VCSGMVEGCPLVRGSITHDGFLADGADLKDIVTWLAGFTEPVRLVPGANKKLPTYLFPDALGDETERMSHESETIYHWETAAVMRAWLDTHDVRKITGYMGMHSLGVFVRVVLRTVNFVEETRKALLGLQMYEAYNALEGYRETLLTGVVSNVSLYVCGRA